MERLKGVGAKRSQALGFLGVETVLDLVTYYPRRYLDRTNLTTLSEVALGEEALILGYIKRVTLRRMRSGRSMVEAEFGDVTGSVKIVFFNQPWRERQLSTTAEVAIFGKVENYKRQLQMTNPVVDFVGDKTGKVVPIYPQSEKAGVSSWDLARYMEEALERAGEISDPLPGAWRREMSMVDRSKAVMDIHFPAAMSDVFRARQRLAFDELFRLQLVLVMNKVRMSQGALGIAHDTSPFGSKSLWLVKDFIDSLPFALTNAQIRAIEAIATDMAMAHPMHRLLQGDVGSGKTLVALITMLFAIQGGHQAALLAPTEVLAEQHFLSLSGYLQGTKVKDSSTGMLFDDAIRRLRVELLTGRSTGNARSKIRRDLESKSIDLVVGTHALLSEGVSFASLGAVVVDEQHRFGVEQRSILKERARETGGFDPDVLVMTATPIPRTAAMTVYGDLDLTVLDELPPGRTPIDTRWIENEEEEALVFAHLRAEIERGRQAYVVCPLVEDSEKIAANSATAEFERLSSGVLSGLRIGLLHGQMRSIDKQEVMESFRSGRLAVLVATTVIEVGVDVANATIMVIEDADRFGIAQLHQLRGRVGRGAERSSCYLIAKSPSPLSSKRLRAMVDSTDGFELAEQDLALRGEGTIMGARQKGRNDLKLASIAKDRHLIELARGYASEMVGRDPLLEGHLELQEELSAFLGAEEVEFLFRS